MQSWDAYLKQWALHARSRSFQRKLDQAFRYIDTTPGGVDGLFLALSGGKDSAACAGLLHERGAYIPWAYMHSAFNFPDTMDVVVSIGVRFGVDVDAACPAGVDEHIRAACAAYGTPLPTGDPEAWDEWDLLQAIPREEDIFSGGGSARDRLLRVVSAGNMLVAYAYEHTLRGSVSGLRAEESKGRRRRAAMWGAHHTYKVDGQMMVCPIQWWSGEDVYAYLVSRDIPLHPYYRSAYEYVRGTEQPQHIRVDLTLVPEFAAARGSMAVVAAVYPEHFARLAHVRPEVLHYV